jgi:molybdenum cofactor cytidylyltransferase
MATSAQQSSVSGVVLAAGSSTRFGGPRPKQLAEIEGESLVRRTVRSALQSRLEEVIVVVGFQADKVREALDGLDVRLVENKEYERGQSTSVKAGLKRVSAAADAAMFVPVDQPLLSAEVIDQLLDAYQESGGPIVVPVFGDRRGAPTMFDRALFPELRKIAGDEGGRQLFGRYGHAIVEVALESEQPLLDIDDLDDYLAAQGDNP